MKKLIATVELCGIPFRVFESDDEDTPHLEDRYGYMDPTRSEILIMKGLSVEMQWNTIVHEMLHGVVRHSGANEAGLALDDEEAVISIVTPHLIRALRSFTATSKGK